MIEPLNYNFSYHEEGEEFAWNEFKPRIVVKLFDNHPLAVPDINENTHNRLMDAGGEEWRQVIRGHKLSARTTFEQGLAGCLTRLGAIAQERAQARDRPYTPPNFFSYFYLDSPVEERTSVQSLVDAASQLRELRGFVEETYVDWPAPDPQINPTAEPRFVGQTHLGQAPVGIDARYAWGTGRAGSAGEAVKLIDLERGWARDHEDLVHLNAQVLYGNESANSAPHGTAVLGIVCAGLNGWGGVGVAPNISQVNVVSHFGRERHNALAAALCEYENGNLAAGDVLLIEVQVRIVKKDSSVMLGPVDVYRADRDVVLLACHLGLIVVEAGGNGTDDGSGNGGLTPPLELHTLGGAQPSSGPIVPGLTMTIPNSGAIIVTAATSGRQHTRLPYAPFGSRIDCYAWGENINTSYFDASHALNLYQPETNPVRPGFGGTSGAAAIIAGAMVVLQGIARASSLRYDGWDCQRILRKTAFGTPPAAGEPTPIGLMPNLRAITNGFPLLP